MKNLWRVAAVLMCLAVAGCGDDLASGGEGGDEAGGDSGGSRRDGGPRDTGPEEDCFKKQCPEGFYCDADDRQCYMKCTSDSSCGSAEKQHCDRSTGQCVECYLDSHCTKEKCNTDLGLCGVFPDAGTADGGDAGDGSGGPDGGDAGDGGKPDAGLGEVTVEVAPPLVVLQANIGFQQFTANVLNAIDPTVVWEIVGDPGDGSLGTLDATGLYRTPAVVPPAGQAVVTATSTEDPSKSATAIVTITDPVEITVSPDAVTLNAGMTQQFDAVVMNTLNPNVVWTVEGGAQNGTIDSAGLYTAPGIVPNPPEVTVRAESEADPSKSATATVTIIDGVTVTVSPATASAVVSSSKAFSAAVLNAPVPDVTWEVEGGAQNGTVDQAGLYQAPAMVPNPPAVELRAYSVFDPNAYGSATITITPPVKVAVSPKQSSLNAGLTRQFSAVVENALDTSVTWSVAGGALNGTIAANGLFTAPIVVPNPAQVTVKAASNEDPTKSDSATITIVEAVKVTVTPSPVNVVTGKNQQFVADVENTFDTGVDWTVTGGAQNGAVGANGLYTAPPVIPNPPVVEVRATSKADPAKHGSAMVTITGPITVTVSPKTTTVNVGLTRQFVAAVDNATDPTVTWAVIGGNPNGSISNGGLYTAPNQMPNPPQVTVRATSNEDPTKYDEAVVTVTTPISVVVSPPAATVNVTFSAQFSATVQNSPNQNVTWAVNGGASFGTINASGLYTAPGLVPVPNVTSLTATSEADPNAAGIAQITIMPPIAVSITPDDVRVAIGQTAQFSAQVGSTQDKTVTWEVVGGAANGTINATGLYTAPNTIPVPDVVSVKATSNADPSRSDTAAAHIWALVASLAGSTFGFQDGTGTGARFAAPAGVALAGNGDLYVADTANNRIRKVTSAGVVTNFCGNGTWGYNGASTACGSANFAAPTGVAVAGNGDVYVADSANNVIRRISGGNVTVVAGNGTRGYAEGNGTTARFAQPVHLALDAAGTTLYVADYGNHRIRKVTTAGTASLFAGSGTAGFVNASGASAQFNGPYGISVDGAGNVYVGDQNNHAIRKITAAGAVTALAGNGTAGSADGTGANARFNSPAGTAVDTNGNVYVADVMNYVIRKVTSAGATSTLAGDHSYGFADGAGYSARFNMPAGVAITSDRKTIYVADQQNAKIRIVRQGL
ncbi:MAG: hypothetical protein HY897_10770 [Deltaproteobacteria bacterium]|nr:hypothetical protein [Deltaproteobacteria bacterium]